MIKSESPSSIHVYEAHETDSTITLCGFIDNKNKEWAIVLPREIACMSETIKSNLDGANETFQDCKGDLSKENNFKFICEDHNENFFDFETGFHVASLLKKSHYEQNHNSNQKDSIIDKYIQELNTFTHIKVLNLIDMLDINDINPQKVNHLFTHKSQLQTNLIARLAANIKKNHKKITTENTPFNVQQTISAHAINQLRILPSIMQLSNNFFDEFIPLEKSWNDTNIYYFNDATNTIISCVRTVKNEHDQYALHPYSGIMIKQKNTTKIIPCIIKYHQEDSLFIYSNANESLFILHYLHHHDSLYNNNLFIINTKEEKIIPYVNRKNLYFTACCFLDNTHLYVADNYGYIKILNVETHALTPTNIPCCENYITKIVSNKNGTMLIVCTIDTLFLCKKVNGNNFFCITKKIDNKKHYYKDISIDPVNSNFYIIQSYRQSKNSTAYLFSYDPETLEHKMISTLYRHYNNPQHYKSPQWISDKKLLVLHSDDKLPFSYLFIDTQTGDQWTSNHPNKAPDKMHLVGCAGKKAIEIHHTRFSTTTNIRTIMPVQCEKILDMLKSGKNLSPTDVISLDTVVHNIDNNSTINTLSSEMISKLPNAFKEIFETRKRSFIKKLLNFKYLIIAMITTGALFLLLHAT